MAENKFFDKINLEHYHRYVSGMIKRLSDNIDERIDEKFKNFIEDNVSDGEILDARGGERTLSDRLNKFDEKYSEVSSQLEHINHKQFVTVDDFEGSDDEKLQQALDYCITNKIDLCINKTYTINQTIIINKGSDIRYKTRLFGGGKIIKNNVGSIFKSYNQSVSDIFIDGITFEGNINDDISCFDCGNGNLIRVNISNCYFDNLAYVFKTDSYLQSIRINNSTFVRIRKSVIECGGLYDTRIDNIIYELSDGQFLNHTKKCVVNNGVISFTLTNSVLEGITSCKDLIKISNPSSVNISNNYFELNTCKNIVFYDSYECNGVLISNNTHLGTIDENQSFITWSGIIHDCKTLLNVISGIKINDTTNITGGRVITEGDYSTLSNKNITSNNTQLVEPSENSVSNNINKVGLTNYIVSSETTGVIGETLICTIKTPIHSGFTVNIKGGGLQANVGMFSVECNYNIIKYNNEYTISKGGQISVGNSNQYDGIICKQNGNDISIYVKCLYGISSNYYLTIYVDGQITTITTP